MNVPTATPPPPPPASDHFRYVFPPNLRLNKICAKNQGTGAYFHYSTNGKYAKHFKFVVYR